MLHIGLLGCGIWGRNILNDLITLGASVTVCDPDADRRQWALQHGALHVTDQSDALRVCDGLIVATPATTHRDVLTQIATFGKPIFVEKPLATSLADAQAIGALVLPPTFLMHIWRYHSGVQLLGELARSGELGEVLLLKTTRTNWTSPRTDTDSLWTLAPHDLTIALELLGHIPPPRAAIAERHGSAIRGMTALLGDRPGVVIDVSTRYADKRREIRLHGTRGVAVLADELVDYVDIWWGTDQTPPDARRHERRFFDAVSPLQRELAALLTYLRGGDAPVSDLAEGIKVVRVLEELIALSQKNA